MQKKRRILTIFLVVMVISSGVFSFISFIPNNISGKEDTQENDINTSDVTYIPSEYPASTWWDTMFRFRTGFEIVNNYNYDRFEPVDIYLTFEDGEHYEDSGRLILYNLTGNDEWSDPIPVQIWNISYYSGFYISSCTITFLANVSANSEIVYFFYHNENLDGINAPSYNTDFISTLAGGQLTVRVGDLGDIYEAVLEEGMGVSELNKDTINFHSENSLSPEKQLSHSSLVFLAHLDEGIGSYVNDATENVSPGTLTNTPTWTDGIVKGGINFDGPPDNDLVYFSSGLEGSSEPFNDFSTEWTISLWLNPTDISRTSVTNHQTRNCFMAKASDPYNDNFEAGITNDGRIHVYIDTESRDSYADFGIAGDVVVGAWNFISIRYESGDVDVRINSNWYTSTTWNGASDMDQAVGSPFTLGSTDHIDNYYDGVMDEVAIFNTALTNEEIEEYKYGAETSTIETITELENGDVFSQYEVNWTASFDMHVSDICTFYYDYSMWNINRTIYFDNEFNGTETNTQMNALNTYYDLSGLSNPENFDYYYDNNQISGLGNDEFIFENYTIIHDDIHPLTQHTIGIFIADVEASGAIGSISNFSGTVNFEDTQDVVNFYSGDINDFDNNNGGIIEPLHIEYWEYIDNFLNSSLLMEHLNNTLDSLRSELDFNIYEKDSKFYNLQVEVTDLDYNIVPGATVKVWNSTDLGQSWEQNTGIDGTTTFSRLNEGTYIVNSSYQKYGLGPLTITSSKTITLNEATTDSSGLNITTFENVEMTSLNLTLHRYNSTEDYQDVLPGASVTFHNYDGSMPYLIGTEESDDNGVVVFRWANSSLGGENITFDISWFDTIPTIINATGDLDGDIYNNNVTYQFYQAFSTVLNVTFGSSFDTNLEILTEPDGTEILGDPLYYQVYYTKIENEITVTPITGASVTCMIELNDIEITSTPVTFSEVGLGIYDLTIDTSVLIQGYDWLSSQTYDIEITATRSAHITKVKFDTINLIDKPATLVPNATSLNAYFGEYLYLDVVYTDVSGGGSNPLNGAIISYSIIQDPSITDFLTFSGSGGLYQMQLITTEFNTWGTYTLQLSANQQNYQTIDDVYISIQISSIKTYINNSIPKTYLKDIQYGDSEIFYFTYTVANTGFGLEDCEKRSYEWVYEVDSVDVDSGTGSLVDEGTGLYSLDFDTETREIGIYHISCTIEKENYATRNPVVLLTVNPREFSAILPIDQFTNNIIQATSGQSLIFTIEIDDDQAMTDITDATLSLTLRGNVYNATNNLDGTYTFTITGLPDAFFNSQAIGATLSISRTNYATQEVTITINVGIVEIFPGFPMFYFLMLIVGVGAVVGSLVAYRYIQVAKIPTFIKKAKAMQKEIKGRKSISEKNLYPSKEEFIAEKYEDYWDILGLDLEDILDFDKKKMKKMRINKNEGGGVK